MITFNFSKFKNILRKNTKEKIYALLLAVVIWIFVTLSIYPNTTITVRNIDVSINVSDTYVNEMGLNVVSGNGQTVTAKISGNRTQIGSLKASDFKAEVSLDGIQAAAEYQLDVIVTPVNPDIDCEIVSVSPSKISVKFDNVVSKTFDVEAQTSAIIPENYVMGTLECSPKTIKVTGSQQQIEKIDRCIAFATTGSITETTSIDADLMLYDAENNVINADKLAFSTTDVAVTIPVYQKKTVPFDLVYRNIPKDFDISQLEYTLSSENIEIAATSEIISKTDKISLSYIDFRNINLDSTFSLDVDLPSGIQNISGIETVEVSFLTDKYISKTFSLSDISVLNSPSGYNINLLTSYIPRVTIIGPDDVLDALTANDIVAQIDLSSETVTQGTKEVDVNIYIPNKGPVWATGEYKATITATAN